MRKILGTVAATGLAAVLATSAHATLITNGSFEATTGFVPDSNDTMVLNPTSTTMIGWTVVSNQLAWIGPTNPFSLTASNGNYFLDLTSYTDSGPFGGVTQSITTITGAGYQLSFDLGGSTQWGVPDSITSCAGATCKTSSITATGLNQWAPETLNFIAAGTSTTISLIGASGVEYIGLDNVSVIQVRTRTVVPEPMTSSLVGLGLIALLAARKKSQD